MTVDDELIPGNWWSIALVVMLATVLLGMMLAFETRELQKSARAPSATTTAAVPGVVLATRVDVVRDDDALSRFAAPPQSEFDKALERASDLLEEREAWRTQWHTVVIVGDWDTRTRSARK
jgi:hypothetical protein